jgi:thiol-disulfide isomerase/thioredoxin
MTGVWVLVGALALAGLAGWALRARNGRITRAASAAAVANLPERVRAALNPATPVTLVQISTSFCAPCRHAGTLLSQLADTTEGLRHVDLDVTETPEVAAELGVLRTPTTLALTPTGAELLRVGGVPKRDELLAALRPHLP